MPWDFWLIFIVLGVLLPWRGQAKLKKLLAQPAMTGAERLALYASTIAFQWFIAIVAAWRAWARGLGMSNLGLLNPGRSRIALAAIAGGVALGTFQWLNLRRAGRMKSKTPSFMRLLAQRILPQSRKELSLYLLLAVTAGLCEEFLYRGFVMAALGRVGLPVWAVVLLSSVLFALAHLYQGRAGLVSTLIIGTVFGAARTVYDSLIPVMAWHATFDAAAGLAGPKYLFGQASTATTAEIRNSADN